VCGWEVEGNVARSLERLGYYTRVQSRNTKANANAARIHEFTLYSFAI